MPRRARDSGSTPVNRAQHPSIINGNILFFSNVDGTIDDEYEGKYNHMVVVLTNAGGDITVALITSKEKSRHLPLKWDPNEPCPGLDLADVIEVKVVTGTPFRVDSYVSLEPFKISKKETLVPLKHGKAEARLASGQLDKLRKKIQGFKLELARGAVPKALPAPHAPIAGPSTSKSATPVPKSSTKKAGRNKKSKGQKSGVRKTGKNSGAAGESSTVVEPTPQTYSADLTTQNYPTISTARAPLDETSTTRSTTASVEPRPWASLLQPIPQNHPTNTSTRTPTTTASRQQYTTNSITQSLTPQPTRPATTTPQTPLHTSQPTQPAVATPQNPLRTSQPTRPAVATPPAPLHSAWRPNRPTAATSQTPLRTSQRNRPAAATPQTPLRRPETIHNNYTNRYNSNVERNSSYHYGSILENGRGDGIRVVGYDEDDEESSGWNLWHLGLFALGVGALFWLKRRK